eukprot:SAG11_NODE_114_length_16040_cov_10.050875_6_plen_310_part_00
MLVFAQLIARYLSGMAHRRQCFCYSVGAGMSSVVYTSRNRIRPRISMPHRPERLHGPMRLLGVSMRIDIITRLRSDRFAILYHIVVRFCTGRRCTYCTVKGCAHRPLGARRARLTQEKTKSIAPHSPRRSALRRPIPKGESTRISHTVVQLFSRRYHIPSPCTAGGYPVLRQPRDGAGAGAGGAQGGGQGEWERRGASVICEGHRSPQNPLRLTTRARWPGRRRLRRLCRLRRRTNKNTEESHTAVQRPRAVRHRDGRPYAIPRCAPAPPPSVEGSFIGPQCITLISAFAPAIASTSAPWPSRLRLRGQ